jgi:glycosyltransferase involved in cell wall biosynthesis
MQPPTSNFQLPTSSLRIAFDAKRAFNNHTGLGNYSRFVIKGMLDTYPQHMFYLCTPSIKPEYQDLFSEYANVKIVSPQNFLGKTFKALWRTFGVTGILNKLEVDVFHGLSNELPANINKFKGKKVVTIHDLIFLRYPHYYKSIDRRIYKRKFLQACVDADVVVAASHQTAKDIESFLGIDANKIKVVYQNCDEQFEVKLTTEKLKIVCKKYNLPEQYFVSIGTIEPRKKQLLVLQAFHQSNTNNHLVFVGKQTEYAQQLHQYINQYNLTNKVHFIEGAAFDDFPALYQYAQMAIYASEFEGFGIPVLEALRSSIPVAVANSSSLTEVGGDAVLYFNNQEELTEILKNAHQTPINAEKVQNQLAKFSPKALIDQIMGIYK